MILIIVHNHEVDDDCDNGDYDGGYDDTDDDGDQEPSGRRMPIARCKPISINQEEGGLCNWSAQW